MKSPLEQQHYKCQLVQLTQLSLQQLWNNGMKVLAQDTFAYDNDQCMYNGPNGTKCVIGHSIDHDIAPDIEVFEGRSVRDFMDALDVNVESARGSFLIMMQAYHDEVAMADAQGLPSGAFAMCDLYWSMIALADTYGIDTTGWTADR